MTRGFSLQRDDPRRDDIAGLAHAAEGDAADAAAAAGDKAADLAAERLVEGCMRNSKPFGRVAASMSYSLAPASTRTSAGLLPFDAVERGHVEHDAALQRNALAVIAGGAAANGQRHAMPGAGRGNAHHLGSRPGA